MAEEKELPEMDWANDMTTNVTCNIENPDSECTSCGS